MELIKVSQSLPSTELGASYLIRLNFGEELREEIEKFCGEKKIGAAWINAIGASSEIEIACYNLEKKEYEVKKFFERLEIVSVMGDISLKSFDPAPAQKARLAPEGRRGKPFLHAHGTFARPSMDVIGGHINRCVISATCEVAIWVMDGKLGRKYDEFTGLHLLCSP